MADIVLGSYATEAKTLPCGCRLGQREDAGPDGQFYVEFTFCEAHRKVKIVKLDPKWPAMAMAAVASVARYNARFTTDDVWEEMDGDGVAGGDPRRMGAIMDNAARDEICVKTDDYVKSTRRECHGRPVRVWASLVVRWKR